MRTRLVTLGALAAVILVAIVGIVALSNGRSNSIKDRTMNAPAIPTAEYEEENIPLHPGAEGVASDTVSPSMLRRILYWTPASTVGLEELVTFYKEQMTGEGWTFEYENRSDPNWVMLG